MAHIVCVPYYSLPEFPPQCTLVHAHDVAIRDILLCNPTNFHVRAGVQYDPHLETAEYMNCQPRVREQVANKIMNGEKAKILFRTRLIKLDGSSEELVTGLYDIEGAVPVVVCRDAPVLKGQKTRFVSIDASINISKVMEVTKAHRSCFTTQNSKWRNRLLRWAGDLENKKDETSKYIKEIERLKKIYRDNEYPGGVFYAACGKCQDKNGNCPLVRRRRIHGSLSRFNGHWT